MKFKDITKSSCECTEIWADKMTSILLKLEKGRKFQHDNNSKHTTEIRQEFLKKKVKALTPFGYYEVEVRATFFPAAKRSWVLWIMVEHVCRILCITSTFFGHMDWKKLICHKESKLDLPAFCFMQNWTFNFFFWHNLLF